MSEKTKKRLLSVKEAADVLGVSTKTVLRGIKSGKYPAIDVGAGTKTPHYRVDISHLVPSEETPDLFEGGPAEEQSDGGRYEAKKSHYSVAEAAAILGENRWAVYRRIKTGTLPFEGHREKFKGSKPYTITREALEKLVEAKDALNRLKRGNISLGDLVLGMQAVDEQAIQLRELRNSTRQGLVTSRNNLERIAQLPYSSPQSREDALYLAGKAREVIAQFNAGNQMVFTYVAGSFAIPAPDARVSR